MLAKYEKRSYDNNIPVWAGKYDSLQNLAHWHNESELIFINCGQASIGINGKIYQAEEGSCFLCSGGDIHYINSAVGGICTIIIFDNRLAANIPMKRKLLSPLLSGKYNIDKFYDLNKNELRLTPPFYEKKVSAEFLSLIIDIFRNEKNEENTVGSNQLLILYQRLLNEIDKNYQEINFSQAAKYMGYSEAYFSRVFFALSGITFTEYLNTVRIEKAVEIIKTGEKKITDIASLCGFNTIRQFNRVFKKMTGIPPSKITSDFKFMIYRSDISGTSFDPTLPQSKLL